MGNLEDKKEICLLNDSFPPLIDGVANTVVNYARVMMASGQPVSVVTPKCPGSNDEQFDYPIIRYPSVDLRKALGYTAGVPFSARTIKSITRRNIGLLHSHCPIVSNLMARELRTIMDVPMVLTYHTKFDVDIANAVRSKLLQEGAVRALVESVNACDELWVVSKGAGENIKSLGYTGEYVVMNNGVDMPKHRASDEEIQKETGSYDLPKDVPVFLFVGRLMWYKGLRLILDALAALKSQNMDFRMVFIGGGGDEEKVRNYSRQLGLWNKVIYTGAIRDRERIAAWYSRADLFLFPSTFDTNGLVVREAAACSLGAVLVKGSCAAEGITNGVNGLFIEENAASLAVCLARVMENKDLMNRLGQRASDDLYYSWDDSVRNAMERYEIVKDNYRSGKYRKLMSRGFELGMDIIQELGQFSDPYGWRENRYE